MKPQPGLLTNKLFKIEEWAKEQESHPINEEHSNSANLYTPTKKSNRTDLHCLWTTSSSRKKTKARENLLLYNQSSGQDYLVKLQNARTQKIKIQQANQKIILAVREGQTSEENAAKLRYQLLESIDQGIVAYYEIAEASQRIDNLLVKYGRDPVLCNLHRQIVASRKLQSRKPNHNAYPTNDREGKVKLKVSEYDETPYDGLQQNRMVKLEHMGQVENKNRENDQKLFQFHGQRHDDVSRSYEKIPAAIQQCFKFKQIHQMKLGHRQSINKSASLIKGDKFQPYQIKNFSNDEEFQFETGQKDNLLIQSNVSVDAYEKIFQIKEKILHLKNCMNKAVIQQLNKEYKRKNKKIMKKNTFRRQSRKTKGKHVEIQSNVEDADDQSDMCEEDCHICRICWHYFDNGHQLGGHMAKKHPGHSLIYRNKRMIKQSSSLERKRKNYIKAIKDSNQCLHFGQEKSEKKRIKRKIVSTRKEQQVKVQQISNKVKEEPVKLEPNQ